MRSWCNPYILGDNDLVSQNVGFIPSGQLNKVRLVGRDQQWINEHAVALNRPIYSHDYSGRVDVLFLLNRNVFNHNVLQKLLTIRRRRLGVFVVDSMHSLRMMLSFGERREERRSP